MTSKNLSQYFSGESIKTASAVFETAASVLLQPLPTAQQQPPYCSRTKTARKPGTGFRQTLITDSALRQLISWDTTQEYIPRPTAHLALITLHFRPVTKPIAVFISMFGLFVGQLQGRNS